MLLRRAVITLDRMLDTALLVLFILLFLIGGYTMYDTWIVYEHAQDTSILCRGVSFLYARNAADFSDPYSLVYGHRMECGAMFGALDKFLDRSYFDGHRSGTLIVMGGKTYDIRLFACVEADGSQQ